MNGTQCEPKKVAPPINRLSDQMAKYEGHVADLASLVRELSGEDAPPPTVDVPPAGCFRETLAMAPDRLATSNDELAGLTNRVRELCLA